MKPFDVEQATQAVMDAAQREVESSSKSIMRAADEAISRMKSEASAFRDLKADTFAALFRESSAVFVGEIDLSATKGVSTLKIANPHAFVGSFGGICIGGAPQRDTEIPNVKHRVITFFLPVEE